MPVTTVEKGKWYRWCQDSPYTTRDPFLVVELGERWAVIRYVGDADKDTRKTEARFIATEADPYEPTT